MDKAKRNNHLERGKSNSHIKLKSLIMAQIERWRNALHMQVERQHGSLLLVASGERVSNISERIQ
jgi:hypothetical protein